MWNALRSGEGGDPSLGYTEAARMLDSGGDQLMPSQWRDLVRPRQVDPERVLWLDVLKLGIEDATRRSGPAQRRLEAREWIASKSADICSFEWVCGELDIAPARLRTWVLGSEKPIRLGRSSPMRGHMVVVPVR